MRTLEIEETQKLLWICATSSNTHTHIQARLYRHMVNLWVDDYQGLAGRMKRQGSVCVPDFWNLYRDLTPCT